MRTWLCSILLIFSVLTFLLSYIDDPEWIYVSAAMSIVNVCICLTKGDLDV